nr:hypothetical protein [Tanacetum cinerariifolium]
YKNTHTPLCFRPPLLQPPATTAGHHHRRRRKTISASFPAETKNTPLHPIYSIHHTTRHHAPPPPPPPKPPPQQPYSITTHHRSIITFIDLHRGRHNNSPPRCHPLHLAAATATPQPSSPRPSTTVTITSSAPRGVVVFVLIIETDSGCVWWYKTHQGCVGFSYNTKGAASGLSQPR